MKQQTFELDSHFLLFFFLIFSQNIDSDSFTFLRVPPSPFLSVCMSICLSHCLFLSVSLFLSLSASVSLCVSLCLCLCLCLSLSLSISVPAPVSLCLCLSLCLSLSLSVCMSLPVTTLLFNSSMAWMWMLDTDKRLRKKTWSSRNVVHQKNNENIMDWKEVKQRSNGNGRIQKSPTQNHQKKTTTIFLAYKQSWWTGKANIERKDLWYQKQRRAKHKIHRQSE